MQRRREKKENTQLLQSKYAEQLAQLASRGIEMRNNPTLLQLLEMSNGEIDVVESLIAEENSTCLKDDTSRMASSEEHSELNGDDNDLSHLKQLRAAGIHGNPMKILAVFHQCHQSIELTRARLAEQRDRRDRLQGNRLEVISMRETYLTGIQ